MAANIKELVHPLVVRVTHWINVVAVLLMIAALAVMVLSGLAIWKPVQLYWLASLMGDYEGARLLHFFAMAAVVLIVVVHVIMVILVPRTFPSMFTGRIRRAS